VIVREDLVGRARSGNAAGIRLQGGGRRPLDAEYAADVRLVHGRAWCFKWLKRNGGVAAMGERNRAKAERLYAAIDGSQFYRNSVATDSRSWMNVTFLARQAELDVLFLEHAAASGLKNLKGHRVHGGMRASLYNAMPLAGVDALVAFMAEFERRHA